MTAHLARIKEDPVAWAFCLSCGVMQWISNFGMVSAKRRTLRGWVIAVQSNLLAGLVELASEPRAGRWRAQLADADRTLGELQLDDTAIQAAITALRQQLKEAREVVVP